MRKNEGKREGPERGGGAHRNGRNPRCTAAAKAGSDEQYWGSAGSRRRGSRGRRERGARALIPWSQGSELGP